MHQLHASDNDLGENARVSYTLEQSLGGASDSEYFHVYQGSGLITTR